MDDNDLRIVEQPHGSRAIAKTAGYNHIIGIGRKYTRGVFRENCTLRAEKSADPWQTDKSPMAVAAEKKIHIQCRVFFRPIVAVPQQQKEVLRVLLPGGIHQRRG